MRGVDGQTPEILAKLPTDVSSENSLVIKDGYIYVVSSDNKQLYKVAMKRRNIVFKEPLTDSSIQQVCIVTKQLLAITHTYLSRRNLIGTMKLVSTQFKNKLQI